MNFPCKILVFVTGLLAVVNLRQVEMGDSEHDENQQPLSPLFSSFSQFHETNRKHEKILPITSGQLRLGVSDNSPNMDCGQESFKYINDFVNHNGEKNAADSVQQLQEQRVEKALNCLYNQNLNTATVELTQPDVRNLLKIVWLYFADYLEKAEETALLDKLLEVGIIDEARCGRFSVKQVDELMRLHSNYPNIILYLEESKLSMTNVCLRTKRQILEPLATLELLKGYASCFANQLNESFALRQFTWANLLIEPSEVDEKKCESNKFKAIAEIYADNNENLPNVVEYLKHFRRQQVLFCNLYKGTGDQGLSKVQVVGIKAGERVKIDSATSTTKGEDQVLDPDAALNLLLNAKESLLRNLGQ